MSETAILWFRRDLRLDDHPALLAAAEGGRRVLGLFVLDPALEHSSGEPRLQFLHRCLAALNDSMGGTLLLVRGKPERVVPSVAQHVGATQVHISADAMPYGIRRDDAVERALDVPLVRTGSPYAVTPGRVVKSDGSPFAVYSPFFRAWTQHGYRAPAGPGNGIDWVRGPRVEVDGRVAVADLDTADDDSQLQAGGEAAASKAWHDFRDTSLSTYRTDRNRPDHSSTSRLSPYLKYGCIHPRTLLGDLKSLSSTGASKYQSELAWREFYADLVFHQPDSLWKSVDPSIDAMRYDTGAQADERFEAWQQGRTGYPFVDAAMRQLLVEHWMHNRTRMTVASFLIKDLHIPWQRGAAHFLDRLMDGDVASNNMGWQWVAGSGAQAAPFYRVFNPILQGEKFDPNGEYVRRYVPELRDVDGGKVHQPWELDGGVPQGYPERIVDHATERAEALRRNKEGS